MISKSAQQFINGLMPKIAEEVAPKEIASTPSLPKALTSKSIFSHPDSHPLTLDMVLLKHFDLEWLTWLSDTLFFEIEQTFSTSIAEANKLKILATQTLHVTDACWEAWEIFEKHLWALNGIVPRTDSIQPPDLPILLAGVSIINSIRKETYGEEVSRYCAAVFLNENVHYAPEPLSFCQPYITQPKYKCMDCNQIGSALPPFDGMCWSCGKHFASEHPFKFEADKDVVKRKGARNIILGITFDYEPIKKRFDELNSLPDDKLKPAIREVSEDIQAAKLITAIDLVKHRNQQLADQLTSLKSWLEAA